MSTEACIIGQNICILRIPTDFFSLTLAYKLHGTISAEFQTFCNEAVAKMLAKNFGSLERVCDFFCSAEEDTSPFLVIFPTNLRLRVEKSFQIYLFEAFFNREIGTR